ncbi:MAG: tetratricopeptide repeat protein [Acidobacteria bacterium]|nr:tetratricopeptide repeat protein [Acidobacteriota bacterium]
MRWVLPVVFAAGRAFAAEPGYVDPQLCARCHPEIARSYAASGMARTFSKVVEVPEAAYYHPSSDRHYRVLRRGSEFFLRRHQTDTSAREVNVLEKRINWVIGSGNRARTFVHRASSGKLIELPLSWYRENGGAWAMSPGYDLPDHLDFRREISGSCLFCHSAYPASWNEDLGAGIDCQRCHGPGEAHTAAPLKANIVNPARLTVARQMDVCLQCHLETASSGIADSIRRLGRGVFSYRPGEPLGDYKLHFDHAPGSGREDKFEINHAGYRLQQSTCFQASRDRMTCTTCHDPHQPAAATPERYRAACRSCHTSRHASAGGDCVSCHMPKRRTEDAVYAVMTDHRIVRRPPARDLLAPRAEDHRPYRGELVFFTPPKHPDAPLYLAAAQVREGNNLVRGIPMLEKALRELRPAGAAFYLDLAEAYRKTGDAERALKWCREAVKREPASAEAWHALGDALLRAGQTAEAVRALERARKLRPTAPVLNTLGIAYGAAERLDDSLRTLKRAVQIDPDLPMAWLNLGVTLEQKNDRAGAESAYREAIRLQPDFTPARRHLEALRSR